MAGVTVYFGKKIRCFFIWLEYNKSKEFPTFHS